MTVEEWKKKNPPIRRKPKTNADRIRAMSDEGLATFLVHTMTCTACQDLHGGKCPKPKDDKEKKCGHMILDWLKSPVEEVDKGGAE